METLESRPEAEGGCASCAFMRSEDTGSKGAILVSSLVGEGVAGGAKEGRVGVDEPSARLSEGSMVWLLSPFVRSLTGMEVASFDCGRAGVNRSKLFVGIRAYGDLCLKFCGTRQTENNNNKAKREVLVLVRCTQIVVVYVRSKEEPSLGCLSSVWCEEEGGESFLLMLAPMSRNFQKAALLSWQPSCRD